MTPFIQNSGKITVIGQKTDQWCQNFEQGRWITKSTETILETMQLFCILTSMVVI